MIQLSFTFASELGTIGFAFTFRPPVKARPSLPPEPVTYDTTAEPVLRVVRGGKAA